VIVVDENIHDQRIIHGISVWYHGRVISVTELRPNTVIKDDAIPMLLCQERQATFVTINSIDFWKKVQPHSGYCVVAAVLPQEQALTLPELLRQLFRLPNFNTRTERMGKVVRLTPGGIEYYQSDRQIQKRDW